LELSASCWCCEELGEADQVVGGQREGEEGFDLGQASELDLVETGDALVPVEYFFDMLRMTWLLA